MNNENLIMQNFLIFIFQKIIYCLFFNGVLKTIFNYNLISKAGFKPCYMSNTIVKQLLIFVQCIFIFTGNVIIYRTYGHFSPDKTVSPYNYCDQTLFDYAFWLTTSFYILLGTSCCCICFCGCLASLLGGDKAT